MFSARYAGPEATYADNCRRLLEEMEGVEDRAAAFVCVLVGLAPGDRMLVACGACRGHDRPGDARRGGFGYDPVFLPEGETRSMAEMTAARRRRSPTGAARPGVWPRCSGPVDLGASRGAGRW